MIGLAATNFTDLDHYAIVAIFIMVLIMLLFGGYSYWRRP